MKFYLKVLAGMAAAFVFAGILVNFGMPFFYWAGKKFELWLNHF